VCGDELTDENWYPSFKLGNSQICKKCQVVSVTEYRLKRRIKYGGRGRNIHLPKCVVCHVDLTDDNWRRGEKSHNRWICKECARQRFRQRNGGVAMSKNPACPLYLGVHVAERVLSHVFKDVERMPMNNPGYDVICNHGKRIDVKSSCKTKRGIWVFSIAKNMIADFFLCLAFDNRSDLNPLNMWMIPGKEVSHKQVITIRDVHKNKWTVYRLRDDKVVDCCNEMRL